MTTTRQDGVTTAPECLTAAPAPVFAATETDQGAPETPQGRQEPGAEGWCEPWGGHPRHYQEQAQASLRTARHQPLPWAWITPTCVTPLCLLAEHLRTHTPRTIEYPPGICVYCGERAGTRDHLLPEPWTGRVQRAWIATVPACHECNSVLTDFGAFSVGERRDRVRNRLRKRYRKVLEVREDLLLAGMGPRLRAHCQKGIVQKEELLRRLSWPTEPSYDERAFQRSGIPAPADLGLL